MQYPWRVAFFVLVVMPSGACWAEASLVDLLSSYRLTAGISLNSVDFDVYDKGSSSPNGTLSEDFSFSPLITVGSPYRYFGGSNWGGLMEYSFSGFQLNRQILGDDPDNLVDLGTSVKGYYAFITPTVFYSFFGQEAHNEKNHALIAGLGAGLGYLKADGDIIFTESTRERVDIDISDASLAVSVFVDYRMGNIMTRVSGGLVTVSHGEFDYDAFGFKWELGYVFGL